MALPFAVAFRSMGVVFQRTLKPQPFRGTSFIRNSPPPYGVHRASSIVILWGPRGALFLMGEAPLSALGDHHECGRPEDH